MQYLHQAHYGNLGGVHTMKPQFVMKGNAIYATRWNASAPTRSQALYTVQGNHVFSTAHNPDGKSPHALFEIRGDKIHTTVHNAAHNASQHVYELRPTP